LGPLPEKMGGETRIQVANKNLIVKISGALFIPIMKEMPEMMYQYIRDYVLQFGYISSISILILKPLPLFGTN